MVLDDVALRDLGVHGRTGPVEGRGTVSNPARQAGVSVGNHDCKSLLPFSGNVCSKHLFNTKKLMACSVSGHREVSCFLLCLFIWQRDEVLGQSKDNDDILPCLL